MKMNKKDGGLSFSVSPSVAALSAALLFLIPYFRYHPYVGHFPAEAVDPRFVAPGSSLLNALCIEASAADPAKRDSKAAVAPPVVTLSKPLGLQDRKAVAALPSVYYSHERAELIAIDRLKDADQRALQRLADKERLSPEAVRRLAADAETYYKDCAPSSGQGSFEGYWAAKGTSVLHHWAHLYDGAFSDGKPAHAQYGFLVPRVANWILMRTDRLGPTHFVQTAWVLFAVIGCIYILLFAYLFRSHPALCFLALLYKVHLFVKLGAFGLLLAPGYHWTRDLVLLLPAALMQFYTASPSGHWIRRPRTLAATVGLTATFLYLLDPLFALVAAFSGCTAYAILRAREGSSWPRFSRRALAGVVLTMALVALFVIATRYSHLVYVVRNLVLGDQTGIQFHPKHVTIIGSIVLLAIATLALSFRRDATMPRTYLSMVAVITPVYYFITPDDPHYYKYLEYNIPFLVSLAAAAAIAVRRFTPSWPTVNSIAKRIAAPLLLAALTAFALVRLAANIKESDLSIQDADGAIFFRTEPHRINGRLIDANMSEELVRHLQAFPGDARFDFLISGFDKYVIFLFDRKNGFDAPDFLAWLDSDERLAQVQQTIFNASAPVSILLDASIYRVDLRQGILSGHRALGHTTQVSKLNTKARLRALQLAEAIAARCRQTSAYGPDHWLAFECKRP